MDGDEILRPEEEVDVLRGEAVLGGAEIDAVKNEIQVVAVRFDVWMVQFAEGILDGQRVKMKDVGQDSRFFRGRLIEIDPDRHAASRLDPGRVHPVDDLSGPTLVFVNGDQSPTLTASAACAAASRATGTRYGEQLT